MHKSFKLRLSLVALACVSHSTFAQNNTGFFATADTMLAHDDNIYRVKDSLAESDNFISVAPKMKVIGINGKQKYELKYSGDYSKFADSEDANFYDHEFTGNLNIAHTSRFSTRFQAYYTRDHEEPGSINRVQLSLSEYNKYEQTLFLAGLTYGSEASIGRFSIDYRRTQKDYLNNNLDYLDNTNNQITFQFNYRLAPKTRLYLESLFAELDYDFGPRVQLDNDYSQYLIGIEWELTSKLSGDISIGYQERNYNEDSIRDIDGLAYNAVVDWYINTYTILTIEAKRESVDSTLEEAGGFLRTSYSVGVEHNISENLIFTGDVGYSKDELVFSSSREDERQALQLALDYELSQNIVIGVNYTYEERDSTLLDAKYKANIIGISAKFSLGN